MQNPFQFKTIPNMGLGQTAGDGAPAPSLKLGVRRAPGSNFSSDTNWQLNFDERVHLPSPVSTGITLSTLQDLLCRNGEYNALGPGYLKFIETVTTGF